MIQKPEIPQRLLARKIPFGPLGKQVFNRTYSHKFEDKTKETWPQALVRAIDGNLGLVSPRFVEDGEREQLQDLLFDFSLIPAGRHLYASGIKGRQFLSNCHVSGYDAKNPLEHFTFLFDQLMMGGGVGANYSNRYMRGIPKVTSSIDLHIICDQSHPDIAEFEHLLSKHVSSKGEVETYRVDDSREGWTNSIGYALRNVFSPEHEGKETVVVVDVSGIRCRGSELKTSGGIACGPGPLVQMLINVSKVFNGCVGSHLSSMDVMLIDHSLADCVIAGGKRRSSRMSVKHWMDRDIFEFINCKKIDGPHWTTNISVEIDDEFIARYRAKDKHAMDVARQVIIGMRANGEPGFWNRSLSQVGERNPEDVYCPNPCGEIILNMWENCFSGEERLLTEEYGSVPFSSIAGETVTVMTPQGWKKAEARCFGEQKVQRVTFEPIHRAPGQGFQTSRSNLRVNVVVTPNHRWETSDGEVTSDLSVGDIVPMNAAIFDKDKNYEDGVRHGIIFGDGCGDRQYANGDRRYRIRLFGNKAKEMEKYFDHLTYPPSCNGAPEAWFRSSEELKEFPSSNKGANYLAGFVDGWCMADGSDRPNGSIHLGASHPQAEEWLRQNAAMAGWVLRAARDSGTPITNYGERKNPLMFFTISRPNSDMAWRVSSIEALPEAVPVYCVTVPGVERFTLSSGIATMNCNLGSLNMGPFANRPLSQMLEAARLLTRWLIRATYGDMPHDNQKEVVARNRRIGVGLMGFHEFIAVRGIKYSDSHNNLEVRTTLACIRDAVRIEAAKYSQQLGIPVPIKNTCMAPTGSTSMLPGTTPSLQCMMSPWFKRLVRYSNDDPELAIKKSDGYEVIQDTQAANTSIVVYWCEDPLVSKVRASGFDPSDILEGQSQIGFSDSLKVQTMFQECFADNAVSFTINLEPDSMPTEEAMEELMMGTIHRLKGTTVFPNKSRANNPIQPLTKAEFDSFTGPKETYQVEEVCVGACPIK